MEKLLHLSDRVLFTPVEPEGVLLNTQTGDRYVLNPVAALVCFWLQTGATVAQIKDAVSQKFPAARDRSSQDVEEFIEELRSENLIRYGDDSSHEIGLTA